jgi:chromosome partitioning protein
MDAAALQAGDQLTAEVRKGIGDAACVVVLLTENSNRSDWVRKEVEFAVGLEKPVFLLSIRSAAPAEWFPAALQDQVRIDGGASLTKASQRELIQRVYQTDRGKIPVVSMLNMKGGVGKTTLAYHLIGCLHDHRKVNVLLIDLDPQHNLTQLMVPMSRMDAAWDLGRSVLSAFEPSRLSGFGNRIGDLTHVNPMGVVPPPENIALPLRPSAKRSLRLDIAIGHFEIVKFSLNLSSEHREQLLENFRLFVEQARRTYGLVIIDLNPGASFLTEAALRCSTHILAPVRPDRYSKRGLELVDRLMAGAMRLERVPNRLAVVNGIKRAGNRAVKDPERQVVNEIRELWPTLSSELGESDLLRARPRTPRADEDLTYWMAHQPWHSGSAIRSELISTANELAAELGV